MKVRKNQNKLKDILKKYKQYILVGVIAAIIIIICIIILITSGVKYNKHNKSVNNVQNTISVKNEYTDVSMDADAANQYDEDANESESDYDGDPQNQNNVFSGNEVNAAFITGDSDLYTNGIDVSKWQGKIDWKKVAASGIDYAMIRIGYRTDVSGTICEDECASYNLINARAAGIKTGVYFFSTALNEDEAVEEANWVIDYIAGYAVTYPVVYRCENFTSQTSRMYNLSDEDITNNAIAFMDTILEEGYDAMLYADKNELEDDGIWNKDDIRNVYPVWISSYSEGAYPSVLEPEYSGICAMWQYTGRGKTDGITGYVDMNVAYFNYDDDADPFAPDRPQDSINMAELGIVFKNVDEMVMAKEDINLRSAPDIRGSIISVLYNGDRIRRTGIGDNGWSRLEYNGTIVYAVSSYLVN